MGPRKSLLRRMENHLARLLLAVVASLAGSESALAGESIVDLSRLVTHPEALSIEVPQTLRKFSIGHLEMDLSAGELVAIGNSRRVVGLMFRGNGSFTYRSEDRYQAGLFAANVKRSSSSKVGGALLKGTLTEALIFDSRLTISPSEGSSAVNQDNDVALQKLLKHFERDRWLEVGNRAAQAWLEEDAPPVVFIQFRSKKDDFSYVFDGLRYHEERLRSMHRFPAQSSLSGWRYPVTLSKQRVTGDRLDARPRRYVVRSVDLELTNRKEAQLELEVRETISIEVPLRTLGFSLWNDRAHKGTRSEYKVETVEMGDGTAIPFSHVDGDLTVQLPRLMKPGQTVDLRFSIAGNILHRPLNHSFWWLPIGNWLPLPDRWDQSAFTYHAIVRVAPPFAPYSMGTETRRWQEDGLDCAEYRLERPVQFAVALAGKYHNHAEERDGLKITLHSYAFKHADPSRRIANNVFELIKFYEPLLGEFPFDDLKIIEINSYGFGVAPPGVIYLTREAFDPGPAGRAYREELNLRMAHEVAHMWWGHVAQMSGPEDQWLSESVAEYYAGVAVGGLIGEHKFRAALNNWKEQAALSKGKAGSIFMANGPTGEKAGLERYSFLYARGPLMLHELRSEVGDQQFFTIMKSYLTNFRFQHVRTEKFIQLTNFITKKDYRPWFEERLFGIK